MKIHYIYRLVNPIDGTIFYVGETECIYLRYRQHIADGNINGNPEKYALIRNIINSGYSVVMTVIASANNKEEAEKIEAFYIGKYKTEGQPITNMNDGGNAPPSQKGKALDHGKKILASTPLKKTVYQYDDNGNCLSEYISVREAGRVTGIDHRSIQSVAAGKNPKRHSAGGYRWKYKKS